MGAIGRDTKHRLASVTIDDEVFDAPSPEQRAAYSEPTRVGRFPLIRRLGAGGMGAVYAAYDELLDRKVALKIVHPERNGSIGQRQRTLVEARALARVAHPSVVAVYEVGEADSSIYISMEYIEGKTLSDWCGDAPRTWRQILDMYLQAGAGLHAAHQAGIVHRDFKPSNVLVGRDGRPRVVDFGLARLAEQSTASVELPSSLSGQQRAITPTSQPADAQDESGSADTTTPDEANRSEPASRIGAASAKKPASRGGSVGSDRVTRLGSISGTPGYMSPEQYIGGDVDALSDQFSFCAALFEALYGFLPFPGETLEELAESVHGPVRAPPPSVKVPLEIHRAILRGLSAQPEDRFTNMSELLAALSIEHGHTAEAGAMSRKRLLRPLLAVALGLLALVALRVAQRTMSTRDAVLSSLVLVSVVLSLGGLFRQTLLSNKFHRRVYLLVFLGVVQNLLQRTVGLRLGWIMKQIFPFEMIVWASVSATLVAVGMRSLLPLPFFLLGMGALATLWQDLPKPVMLATYLVLVASTAWSWVRVGRSASAASTKEITRTQRKSGSQRTLRPADSSSRSSPGLRPARGGPSPRLPASQAGPPKSTPGTR